MSQPPLLAVAQLVTRIDGGCYGDGLHDAGD